MAAQCCYVLSYYIGLIIIIKCIHHSFLFPSLYLFFPRPTFYHSLALIVPSHPPSLIPIIFLIFLFIYLSLLYLFISPFLQPSLILHIPSSPLPPSSPPKISHRGESAPPQPPPLFGYATISIPISFLK